jgi:hypothetical protein
VAVKPKEHAAELLAGALCILVALDHDEAGAKAWPWWETTYQQARLWPVPKGKDPGEAFAQGRLEPQHALARLALAPRLELQRAARLQRQRLHRP